MARPRDPNAKYLAEPWPKRRYFSDLKRPEDLRIGLSHQQVRDLVLHLKANPALQVPVQVYFPQESGA